MYSKRNTLIVVLLIALVFVGGFFTGYQYNKRAYIGGINEDIVNKTSLDVRKLAYIYEYVLATHVRDDVSKEDMNVNAIKGMLSGIDNGLTRYQTAEEYEASSRTQGRGDYAGIGLVVNAENGVYSVVAPYKGTPADKAGLKTGDIIAKVNGQSVDGWSLDKIGNEVRGPIGEDVTLTIIPADKSAPYDVTITRAKIEPPVVAYELVGENKDIAHVNLYIFNSHSVEQLENAIDKMIAKGAKSLILDLRGNPGGDKDACIGVADLFLNKNKVVFETIDREGVKETNLTQAKAKYDMPVYVLINKGSASASEVITGTIMDNNRGISIGKNSYGKASVQTGYPLNGAVLWVTTHTYLTPNGTYIDKIGIKPNVEIPEDVYKKAALDTEKDLILEYAVNWIEDNE
ncbi:S41 family peptidase [Clostridium sp. 'deep sea']|uniref:S41 family peptidase n=1 Tax=Clostridium sp. 'deep sea' TaxID=2779445 RepID=UPI00189684A1|nr:S41 family peptidase [Clostridium sp. 'deep sea']QOR35735.1 S41 family peptidase [Clostridium sp. 'deep sea']